MNRMRVSGLAGLVALAAVSTLVLAAEDQSADRKDSHDRCAKACNDCQRICDACATHCAHMIAKGKKEHLETLQTCRDCASFCAAAAQIVARHGPMATLICQGCAEACERCGQACEKHGDSEMMKRCAEECKRCARECRDMVKHGKHPEHRGR